MALENAKKFMEELDSNEKALEILKAHELADDDQGIAALASAARETGYDVSDEICSDTFEKDENCVLNDSCKKIIQGYAILNKEKKYECINSSYAACNDGLMIKPDCKLGRLGF